MEHRAFDTLVKQLAQGSSRRSLLKGVLGLGGAAAAGTLLDAQADAARRGYSGPFPKPTVIPGPPTCNDQNCYGCRECVNGICTPNPQELCYDHTDQCLTSVCNPDGGCSYPFDCRVNDGCCGYGHLCNQSSGQCECDASLCCGVDCPGCQECENGACVRKPENCYDHTDQCLASVCNADGGCSYPFDCRVKDGCCKTGETCSSSDGQCVASA